MKRRLISMILCILTVLVLLPTAALAEENEPAEAAEAAATAEPSGDPEIAEEPTEEPEEVEEPTEAPEEVAEATEEPEEVEEPEEELEEPGTLVPGAVPGPVDRIGAEETTLPAPVPEKRIDADGPSNDELFEGYVDSLFRNGGGEDGPETGIHSLPSLANLTPAEQYLEKQLKSWIKKVAAGERSSTSFDVVIPSELASEFLSMDEQSRDVVYYALRLDCTYEMFWADAWSFGCSFRNDGGTLHVDCKFRVSADYRGVDLYHVDTKKLGRVRTAVNNAKQIVKENANRSDYYKLLAYYNKVSALSEYNDGYANCEYGDVWQLIYVFDGDPNTKVVCEGFAKAFEYLCNQSTFNGNVNAFCADGTVIWSNGSYGNHMWNVVRMDDGRSYVIDVTAHAGGSGTPVFLSYAAGQLSGLPYDKGLVTEQNVAYSYYILEQNANGSYDIKNSQTIPAVPAEYRVISTSPYVQPDSAPVITAQPQNVITVNGYGMLSVSAKGGNLSYRWQAYRPGDKWRDYAFGTSALEVDPVNVDGWLFRCIVTNGKGKAVSEKAVVLNANLTLGCDGYKGSTPYAVHTGAARTPSVTLTNANGQTRAVKVSYRDNVNPGTAYADVTLTGSGAKFTVWFKIYLPPTASTQVSNAKNGIRVSWSAVPGAKGYVIYRKARNASSSGWTTFARWNNTTGTSWTDTKVYAGTRYVYAVKAYFSDPMDNYNLGLAGPKKEITRIVPKN